MYAYPLVEALSYSKIHTASLVEWSFLVQPRKCQRWLAAAILNPSYAKGSRLSQPSVLTNEECLGELLRITGLADHHLRGDFRPLGTSQSSTRLNP